MYITENTLKSFKNNDNLLDSLERLEESEVYPIIAGVHVLESSRLDKNIVKFEEAVKFMKDSSLSLMEFIESVAKDNRIEKDSIAFSILPESLMSNNDYMEYINALREMGNDVYVANVTETTLMSSVLDEAIELCMETNTLEPLDELFDNFRANLKNRLKQANAGALGQASAETIRRGTNYIAAGAKSGLASGLANRATNVLMGGLDTKDAHGRTIRNGRVYDMAGGGTTGELASDAANGIRNKLTGDLNNVLKALMGVDPNGRNAPGMVGAITDKIGSFNQRETKETDPVKKGMIKRIIQKLVELKNKILNRVHNKQQH